MAGLLIILSTPAQTSSLVAIDWIAGTGDEKLTRDTRTGLDWLDLTETTSRSASSILSGYGGWVNNGFRYATGNEIYSLLETAGVLENMDRYGSITINSTANNVTGSANLLSLQNLIGTTYKNNPNQYTAYGYFLDIPFIAGSASIINYSYFSTIPGQSYQARVYYSGTSLSGNDSLIGSFLVRDTPLVSTSNVPTPTTLWLLISGFAGYKTLRRKK